jgi:hypothetical protein
MDRILVEQHEDDEDDDQSDPSDDLHMPPDSEEDFERAITHADPEEINRPIRIPPAPAD